MGTPLVTGPSVNGHPGASASIFQVTAPQSQRDPMLKILFVLSAAVLLRTAAYSQCTASGDPAVAICIPTDGSSVGAPVHLQIGTNDTGGTVDLLQVYYNFVKRWENHVSSADIYLAAGGGGAYRITAIAHDTAGRWFQSTVNVSITQTSFTCATGQTDNQQPHTVLI